MSPSNNNRLGFTVLEVVIAFTILAMGLAALLQAFGAGMAGVSRAEAEAMTVLAVRSLLDQVGTAIPLEPGVTQAAGDGAAAWQVTIDAYEPEQVGNLALLPVEAMRVTATVEAPSGVRAALTIVRLRRRVE